MSVTDDQLDGLNTSEAMSEIPPVSQAMRQVLIVLGDNIDPVADHGLPYRWKPRPRNMLVGLQYA